VSPTVAKPTVFIVDAVIVTPSENTVQTAPDRA